MMKPKEMVSSVALMLMSTGCTLVYDGDVFAKADATRAIQPSELAIDSVEPNELFEGLGALESARPIPVVIHGSNIAPGAQIELFGAGIDLDVPAQVSGDGTLAATTIRVPVNGELAAGATATVTIRLRQGDGEAVSDETSLDVQGLDEFTAVGGILNSADLAPRYSTIEIGESLTLVGDVPARFVATASIHVSSEIRADGRDDGQRSAGGFLGGLAEQDGGGTSGGGQGTNKAGGGGAGNLAVGGNGQGDGAGSGGAPSNVPYLFPLAESVGGGGGGGGGAALDAAAGGAGAGALELAADGPITLAAGTALSADGFDGVSTSSCVLGGGGGGGGAGGAILIRTATELIADSGLTTSVAGGAGGSKNASGTCSGGDGSAGRIRADFPLSQGSVVDAVRGPTWVVDSIPAIVTDAALNASLAGDIGATYFVQTNGEEATMVTLAAATETVALTLSPGLNKICALVAPTANQGQPESIHCQSIAYLP